MYLISILVPVYGVEDYIERCARSLFEQTYQNLEFIFVDDCTPDRSIDILETTIKDYPNRLSQLRIIRHNKRKGIAATRNTAINAANGLFICHIDSDDFMEVDAIRLMAEEQQKSQADIITAGVHVISKKKDYNIRQSPIKNKEQLLFSILNPNFEHTIWGRLIRLSLYKDYGIMNKEGCNQGEEWWVIPRLIYYSQRVSCTNQVLYHYDRTRDNSMCAINSKNNKETWQNDILSIESVVDFFSDKEEKYKRASLKMAVQYLYMYLCLSAYYGEKEVFRKIRNKIATNDSDILSAIGWNHSCKRNLMGNYYFCKYYHLSSALIKCYYFIKSLT